MKVHAPMRTRETVELATLRAVSHGYTMLTMTSERSMLTRHAGSTSALFHVVNILAVLVTAGAWIIVYVPLWIMAESATPGARTLEITIDPDTGEIIQQLTERK